MAIADLRSSCYGFSCGFSTENAGGNLVGWLWTFGDSATSTFENPSHDYAGAGTYTVSVTVTDAKGANNSAWGRVTIPVSLNAAFTATCEGTTCTFSNQSTGWVGAFWEFGDGTTSTDWSPFHVYQVSETTRFVVRLTVTDWELFSDTMIVELTVTP